jgi:hypothetical protein
VGIFLQGFPIGGDGLFEPRRPALPLAESKERIAKIHLRHGPIERHALAGIFLQGVAIGGDGLFEPRRPALPRAERLERIAEMHLGCGPIERSFRTRRESEAPATNVDRIGQRGIVAEFVPLFVKVHLLDRAGNAIAALRRKVRRVRPLRHISRRRNDRRAADRRPAPPAPRMPPRSGSRRSAGHGRPRGHASMRDAHRRTRPYR